MGNSMQHWNGSQMCAIDTETTGLDPSWHEIVQLSLLPLDSNFEIRKDVAPFSIYLRPDSPERADKKALKVNGLSLSDLTLKGFDQEAAKDMLKGWIDKLGLPYTKYGRRKEIIPLGQNYAFDKAFISAWLGADIYFDLFGYHYRDTMIAAGYLNDRAAYHGETIPFPKIGLKYLASQLTIPTDHSHDALSDCQTTAKVYQKFVQQGLLG